MWQLIAGAVLISVPLIIAAFVLQLDKSGLSVWALYAFLCGIVWFGGRLLYVAGGL